MTLGLLACVKWRTKNVSYRHNSEANNRYRFQQYCLIYQILQILSAEIIVFIKKSLARDVFNIAVTIKTAIKFLFYQMLFHQIKKWFKKYQHFSWHIFLILLSSAIQVFLLLSPMSCGEYNPSQIVSLSFFEVNTD